MRCTQRRWVADLQHHAEDVVLCVSPEGREPTEQDVQDDAQAPHVCLKTVAPPQDLQPWRASVLCSSSLSHTRHPDGPSG